VTQREDELKITFEIPDPKPTPAALQPNEAEEASEEISAPAAPPAPKPAPTLAAKEQPAKSGSAKKVSTVVDTPTPGPVSTPSAPVTTSQSSSSGDFDNMGGICNISDPDANNPNVFHFKREE
jgi:hypothetical protein